MNSISGKAISSSLPGNSNRLLGSGAPESTAQAGRSNGLDWKEEIYQKIQTMKEMYLPVLNKMYQNIALQLQRHDPVSHPLESHELQKLKKFKAMIERMIAFLQVSKHNITPADKEKSASYDKQIMNFINANRNTKQQLQLGQPHIQQPQSQVSKVQSRENQMNAQQQASSDDAPVPDVDLLPGRETHCSITGIYAKDPLVDVDISSALLSQIPIDFLSEDHPIGELIAPIGLHFLRTVDSRRTPHKELLSALAERWWPSTDTFHFAWGEMTMTPADFSAISGIPFGSRPLQVHYDWRRAISSAQMIDLIGVDFPRGQRCIARTFFTNNAHIVYDGYTAGTISVGQAARFTIISLIAATFYADKRQAIDPGILKSLVDLSYISEYDWAGAMLCRLYEDMYDLSRHHIRVWAYGYFPCLAPSLIDPLASYFPVSWRWFSQRIHDRSLELSDRRSITALRTFFDTAAITKVTPNVFFSILSSRVQENPRFHHSIQRTSMRFLLPHPFHRRYYLGERVTFQHIRKYIVPMDPPFDMLSGDSMIVNDEHHRGIDYGSLVSYDTDYASFRTARLMPPIGDRFKSLQRRPRTVVHGSSHRAFTGRGGGRSSPDTRSADSSDVDSSRPPLRPSGRPHPPRPCDGAPGHLRVPPSITEADRPVGPILTGVRLPYELAYGEPGAISYLRIPVEEPDRSLPIARITEVPKGYIQDLLDYIAALSYAFSSHLTICERDRAWEPRKRPRR